MYARYTEYLRDFMLNPDSAAALEKALSTYPLYHNDKAYDLIPTRSELNTRLLNNYKYREIGFETFGRFLDELEITMNNIMPYYNEMFKTVVTMAELDNPFDNTDVVETFEQTTEGQTSSERSENMEGNTEASGTTETNGKENGTSEKLSKNIHTDTPQTSINIPEQRMDETMYATDVTWNREGVTDERTNNNTVESNDTTTVTNKNDVAEQGTTKTTTTHKYHKIGNQGVNTYAHDMNEFRTSIIDVVDQIINDERVNELFMLVY